MERQFSRKPILSSTSLSGAEVGESVDGGFKNKLSKCAKLWLENAGVFVWMFFPPFNPLTIPPKIPGAMPCAQINKLIQYCNNTSSGIFINKKRKKKKEGP